MSYLDTLREKHKRTKAKLERHERRLANTEAKSEHFKKPRIDVHVDLSVTLNLEGAYPDGNVPEELTAQEIIRLMQSHCNDPSDVLSDWNLIDGLDLYVVVQAGNEKTTCSWGDWDGEDPSPEFELPPEEAKSEDSEDNENSSEEG